MIHNMPCARMKILKMTEVSEVREPKSEANSQRSRQGGRSLGQGG